MLHLQFDRSRKFACITVGRANVDFYPQVGETLEKARSYDVFVGGSPANIAAGMAKIGLPMAILTRVADDRHGKFVADYLSSKFGIDTSQVQYDSSGASTSLAFAERRADAMTIMYRNNVADLKLDYKQVPEEYIASASVLFISGTALSAEPSRYSVFKLLEMAQKHNTLCAIDIDYRPYSWSSQQAAAAIITRALAVCDVIIGTREEFEVGGISVQETDEVCAKVFLEKKAKLVIVKHAHEGSNCMYLNDGKVELIKSPVFYVNDDTLVKPFGAGDAFASSLLACLYLKYPLERALEYAAASASINISKDSCTEAMPELSEIETYITQYKNNNNNNNNI